MAVVPLASVEKRDFGFRRRVSRARASCRLSSEDRDLARLDTQGDLRSVARPGDMRKGSKLADRGGEAFNVMTVTERSFFQLSTYDGVKRVGSISLHPKRGRLTDRGAAPAEHGSEGLIPRAIISARLRIRVATSGRRRRGCGSRSRPSAPPASARSCRTP